MIATPGRWSSHRRWRVVALVDDRDVRILSETGDLLGHFIIDLTKKYQAKLQE
jgi:hypothetical protein